MPFRNSDDTLGLGLALSFGIFIKISNDLEVIKVQSKKMSKNTVLKREKLIFNFGGAI